MHDIVTLRLKTEIIVSMMRTNVTRCIQTLLNRQARLQLAYALLVVFLNTCELNFDLVAFDLYEQQ